MASLTEYINRKGYIMKGSLPRQIPENAEQVQQGRVTAYLYTNKEGRPCLRVFVGNASKPAFSFYYFTEADRQHKLESFIAERAEVDRIKAERKEIEKQSRRQAAQTCEVGDIFRSCWGYEQTNIDYYQVVAISGLMVTVREIAQCIDRDSSMSGTCTPDTDNFIGSPMKKRLNAYDGRIWFRISSFASATRITPRIIDGKKVYESSYWSSYA